MSTVKQILAHKGASVVTISPTSSALDAALLMNEHRIGALVVVEGGRVVGIISERDMLQRVIAPRCDPAECTVDGVMTREVVCCGLDTPLQEARAILMYRRIRHLPVVNAEGGLEGMISIGDLNAWDLHGQEQQIHFLHEYLYGRI